MAGKRRKKSSFHGKIKSETTGIETINNDTTKIKQQKNKEPCIEQREIFTPRKNIGESDGSVKIKTRRLLRMIYELPPIERIIHAKQKIKLLAEGDRAKTY